jgi:hypothetical protein
MYGNRPECENPAQGTFARLEGDAENDAHKGNVIDNACVDMDKIEKHAYGKAYPDYHKTQEERFFYGKLFFAAGYCTHDALCSISYSRSFCH